MATIIEQGEVCDGYDVVCTLADGSRHVFHFLAQPADVQAAVDKLEADMPEEDEYEIIGEPEV